MKGKIAMQDMYERQGERYGIYAVNSFSKAPDRPIDQLRH